MVGQDYGQSDGVPEGAHFGACRRLPVPRELLGRVQGADKGGKVVGEDGVQDLEDDHQHLVAGEGVLSLHRPAAHNAEGVQRGR